MGESKKSPNFFDTWLTLTLVTKTTRGWVDSRYFWRIYQKLTGKKSRNLTGKKIIDREKKVWQGKIFFPSQVNFFPCQKLTGKLGRTDFLYKDIIAILKFCPNRYVLLKDGAFCTLKLRVPSPFESFIKITDCCWNGNSILVKMIVVSLRLRRFYDLKF